MPRLERRAASLMTPSALAAALAALVLAGCSSSPGTPSASSVATTSSAPATTSTTTSSSTTTSTVPPTAPVAVTVESCPTTVALATPPAKVALPATETVSVPADQANYLVVFSDDSGVVQMLGPRGWICKASYGADGSGGMLLQPAGGELATAGSAGHVASTSAVEAIEGYETGASPVQGAALACPVVPTAAAALQRDLGKGCAAHPAAETLLPASANNVAFVDPPGTAGTGVPSGGLNAATGVVLYLPGGNKSSAYLATCTLPVASTAVCSSVLHFFVSLYG
jgi:hypothetical protein